MSNCSAFTQLLSPHSIEDFFANYWERNCLYISRDNAKYYQSILSSDDIDSLLQNKALLADYNNFRLVNQGQLLALEQWAERHPKSNQYMVNNDKLFEFLNQGMTLTINGAHKSIPKLRQYCSALETELHFKLRINLYITPPQAQGLAPHYDEHDVLILQIAGTKQWKVYHSPIELPSQLRDTNIGRHKLTTPQLEPQLAAGDLLYIPRGFIHQACTTDQTSVHASLGLYPTYWFELLEQLTEIAKENASFRRAIPHGFSRDEEQQDFQDEFLRLSQDLVNTLDVNKLLRTNAEQFISDKKSEDRGRFNDLLLIDTLGLETVLSRRRNILYTLEDEGPNIHLNFYQRKVTLSRILKPSLNSILELDSFQVKDIGGLINDEGRVALAKKLIRAGFLCIES